MVRDFLLFPPGVRIIIVIGILAALWLAAFAVSRGLIILAERRLSGRTVRLQWAEWRLRVGDDRRWLAELEAAETVTEGWIGSRRARTGLFVDDPGPARLEPPAELVELPNPAPAVMPPGRPATRAELAAILAELEPPGYRRAVILAMRWIRSDGR